MIRVKFTVPNPKEMQFVSDSDQAVYDSNQSSMIQVMDV